MKFKAKSMLAMAVLLSVMSVGTLAEAEFKYKVDDGAEETWGSYDLKGTGNKLEVWSIGGSDYSLYSIYGGYTSDSSPVESKTVIFKSGNVNSVYGGYSEGGDATGNIVVITGGTVRGIVAGGYCYGSDSGSGEERDNKVIISGGNLSAADVYGHRSSAYSHSNNTLQIENSVTIRGIHDFENISFVLPAITGDKTLLSLTNAFSVTGVKVGVNLGENANSDLNTYEITLADKFSGNFDVTYYDKNDNATGYVEKFNLTSAGAMKLGKGAEMHVVSNLTTDAGELLGKQDTIYVDSGKTLTFNSGTLEKKIKGACNLIFAGDVTANADNIAATGTNTVNSGKTLTFNGGTLLQTITGAGNIFIDGDVTSDFTKLANTGFWAVNAGTLTFTSESNLAKNIAGTGTVKLGGTLNVLGNQSIEGTLDGNGQTVNMTNNTASSPINYLMVGTLKGNTDLQLDVDLSRLTSDMILANAVDSGANINVKSINITADNPAGMPTASNIIFLTENGGTPTHGTYTVNSPTGSITMTNTHTYKFEIGGNGILQCREIGGGTVTFKDFIEGTNTSTADTFSLTADYNYTDTGTADMAAGTQTHNTLNINLNGHNLNKTSTVMTVATGAKTLNVNGGSAEGSTDLNFDVASGGTLNISGKTDVKGNITNEGTTTFAGETKAEGTLSGAGSYTNSGTMTVEDASKLQMTNGLENTGTLNLGNTTNSTLGANITGTGTTVIAGDVTNNDKTITQNTLNITGTFSTNADKLVIAEVINNSGNVTFNGGTLAQKVQGTGNITIDGDVTTNANYIATTGTNTVASGKKVTFNAGTLTQKIEGAGDLSFDGNVTVNADCIATTGTNEVTSGATLNFAGGTLRKNMTGSGTAEFNGTVCVADGVQLGTATNNVNGTLDLAGHITTGTINFKNGSTLKVDGNQIIGTEAIYVTACATVESGAKLYVSNAVGGTPYKILAGSGINVSGWQTDAEMGEGFKAAYGLKVDTSSIINDGYQFTIKFIKDSTAIDNIDIGDLLSKASPSSALYKYVDTLSQVQPDRATQATIINTMANMNSLANVQQGTQAVMAMATDALQTNIGTGARPMLGDRYQGSGVRNVSANDKDRAAIETVEQGKSDEVMPTMVENEEQKYDKTVWANYIHSKKTIDGLKTGHLTQNSTIQYNGVTVGADLWSNAKGFGGLALTTAEGKTNSSQDGASVKNDTDYHGVSLYQRYDYKEVAILFDLSYTHAKNDVTMSTAGTTDVTAKPKSDAYSAGVKVEYPVKIGHSSQLTPYTGVRYTHIHTDKYDNSLGISNDIKDQNLVNIPIGVQLKTEYTTNTDWKFGHIFEGGYVWNVGNRQSEQRLGYLGVYDSIDFDVTDRGEYFLKTAFTANHKDTDFELGYRFTRGDNTKDNKWNFNVTYNFGNANGLPYKSVLLGKIDLLESANKALRAENVELNNQVKDLQMTVTDLQEENERKDLELAEVKAENERKDLRIAELEALLGMGK